MLKMQGLIQSKAFVMLIYMVTLTQFQFFCPSGTFSQSRSHIYIYIYIFPGRCHTATVYIRVSKLMQLTIFHRSSHHVCIGTVIVLAVVQLLQSKMRQTRRAVSRPLLAVLFLRARKPIETAGDNTCSQKRASCLGNSRREREAFSSMLSAARSTREARYEQMCHLLSHQRRLEAETPATRRGKHV